MLYNRDTERQHIKVSKLDLLLINLQLDTCIISNMTGIRKNILVCITSIVEHVKKIKSVITSAVLVMRNIIPGTYAKQ